MALRRQYNHAVLVRQCSLEIRFCVDDAGEDVQVLVESTEEDSHSGETSEEPAGSEEHCHFHAGVE